MTSWLMLMATVALTAFSNLMLKGVKTLDAGPRSAGQALLAMIASPKFLLGGFCLALGLVPYTIALRKIELSVAYPVMTTSVMVLVSLASIVFLHESFTLAKAAGMAAIVCGVILLSAK
jgi:multidrug transporter EmrE-like cation transporter